MPRQKQTEATGAQSKEELHGPANLERPSAAPKPPWTEGSSMGGSRILKRQGADGVTRHRVQQHVFFLQ